MRLSRVIEKDSTRLYRTYNGWWWGYRSKLYGYTLPDVGPELVTRSKAEARKWWKSKK